MKRVKPYRFLSVLFLSFTCFTAAQAAVTEVTASVDKNPIVADESVTLTVTADDDVDRSAFDSSALLKDFIVGRTSVSSQTRMVNFKTSRSTTWSTVLIPRKPGVFTIPSFEVKGVSTAPIELRVVPATQAQGSTQRDIFMTTEVDHTEVYLQQQIKYTIKLHLAGDLKRGSLQAPQLESAQIRQIGKDNEYSEIIDGKRYRIIERVFALIPQSSGEFTIQAPYFEGEVVDTSRQGFGFFNRTRSVNRVASDVEITVKPIPQTYTGHWLPSEYVTLTEEWQPDPVTFKVGEPITRTVVLTALGLVEEQLPAIQVQYPDALKVYPEQPTSATVDRDKKLIAQRTESVAVIPQHAGEITLPAIEIPWFNVNTGQTEYARLAKRTINVEQSSSVLSPPIPAIQPATTNEQQAVDTNAAPALSASEGPVTIWQWTSIGLFALWLATILWWRISHNRQPPSSEAETREPKLWQAVLSSLKRNDPQALLHHITQWLGYAFDMQGTPLIGIQQKLRDEQLDSCIAHIHEVLYSPNPVSLDRTSIETSLVNLRQRRVTRGDDTYRLQSLYSSHR